MFFKKLKENAKMFLKGMSWAGAARIRGEAIAENDIFYLLCFSDLLGIPNPGLYYTLEILPYMSKEIRSWEWKMLIKDTVSEAGEHDIA